MPKYKLIKDLPCQKADDTEWEIEDTNQQVVRFSTSPSAYQATIFRSKEEKRLFWEESWGDPLTSGWFEEVKPKRFRAKMSDTYFFITETLKIDIDQECECSNDGLRYENFNYFRTKEQAQEAGLRIKKLLAEYQEEINKE